MTTPTPTARLQVPSRPSHAALALLAGITASASADWSSQYADATIETHARSQATIEETNTTHPAAPPAEAQQVAANAGGHWATATGEVTHHAEERFLGLSARSHAIAWQNGDGTGDVEARSRSAIAATLDLDDTTTIDVAGTWQQAYDCWWERPYIEATLVDEDGVVVWNWSPPLQDDCESVSSGMIETPAFVLDAGRYHLELSVESSASDFCDWDPDSGWENWCRPTDLDSPWSNWQDALFAATIEFSSNSGVPGDLDGDGRVNGADLGLLFVAWGTSDIAADLNGDGIVDGEDLGLLFSLYG